MAGAYRPIEHDELSQYRPDKQSGGETSSNATKIGLIGEPGSGRTSFVNAIMRYSKKTPIKVSPTFVQTTYHHPSKPKIEFHDLPGVGIAEYPNTGTYFEKLGLGKNYNAFLLFSKGKFTIDTLRLAVRLRNAKKPFLIVKPFIDLDLENDEIDDEKNFEQELKKIKDGIADEFEGIFPIGRQLIFLISNVEFEKWEFPRLYHEVSYLELINRASTGCETSGGWLTAKLAYLMINEKREKFKTDKATLIKFLKKQMPDAKSCIKKEGLLQAQKLIQNELNKHKKVKIEIAVIGRIGVGKSNFINTIRGLKEKEKAVGDVEREEKEKAVGDVERKDVGEKSDKNLAKSGITESTIEAKRYHIKENENIGFWDCPGLGSTTIPDIDTFSRAIEIEKYDAFIVMSSEKFSTIEDSLITKLKSLHKPFFFVKSKIDVDKMSAEADDLPFGGEQLEKIKSDCLVNLKIGQDKKNDIFLISNKLKDVKKWDFPRLEEAMKDRLPVRKQECFLFSMLTLSKDILEDKVKSLKNRVPYYAFLSVMRKAIRKEDYSWNKDVDQIVERVESYKQILGFPTKDSEEFKRLSPELQNKVQRFFSKDKVRSWLEKVKLEPGEDEPGEDERAEASGDACELPPWLNINEANEVPYRFVYRTLCRVLDEMKNIAEEILNVDCTRLDSDSK